MPVLPNGSYVVRTLAEHREIGIHARCSQCGSKSCELEDGTCMEIGSYSTLLPARAPAARVDLGRELRRARWHAQLTREELAEKTGGGPAGELAGVEAGYIGVSAGYVTSWLSMCGRPRTGSPIIPGCCHHRSLHRRGSRHDGGGESLDYLGRFTTELRQRPKGKGTRRR